MGGWGGRVCGGACTTMAREGEESMHIVHQILSQKSTESRMTVTLTAPLTLPPWCIKYGIVERIHDIRKER